MAQTSMPKQNVVSASPVAPARKVVAVTFSMLIPCSVSAKVHDDTKNENRKVIADQFFIESVLA